MIDPRYVVVEYGTGFAIEPDGTKRPLTEEEHARFRAVADRQTEEILRYRDGRKD